MNKCWLLVRRWGVVFAVSVLGSAVLLGACGWEDDVAGLPRSEDGLPVFDLREPTPTSEFGGDSIVATFQLNQRVQVLLPTIEFEIDAIQLNLFSPNDWSDPAEPSTEPNLNPINNLEFWVVTTADIDAVFGRIDEVIDIFGTDDESQQKLAELRTTLETTSVSDLGKSNVFMAPILRSDEFQISVRISRSTGDELHTVVVMGFFNGVYDGDVFQWPLDPPDA